MAEGRHFSFKTHGAALVPFVMVSHVFGLFAEVLGELPMHHVVALVGHHRMTRLWVSDDAVEMTREQLHGVR